MFLNGPCVTHVQFGGWKIELKDAKMLKSFLALILPQIVWFVSTKDQKFLLNTCISPIYFGQRKGRKNA